MEPLIYEEESYQIRGAVFHVYNELGLGFLEAVYQEALMRELYYQKIPFVAQPQLHIFYRGEKMDQYYKPDFLCYEKIIIEIKAVQSILPEHQAQLMNYLKVTGCHLGFLVNFSHYPGVKIERFVNETCWH